MSETKVSDELRLLLEETRTNGPAPGSTVIEVFTEWVQRYEVDSDCEESGLLPAGYTTSISCFVAAAYRQCIDQGLLPEET